MGTRLINSVPNVARARGNSRAKKNAMTNPKTKRRKRDSGIAGPASDAIRRARAKPLTRSTYCNRTGYSPSCMVQLTVAGQDSQRKLLRKPALLTGRPAFFSSQEPSQEDGHVEATHR